ncbi:hypothetical protein AB0M02_29520 [Actinoplanes sp. NPDC051861]|uniref:Agd3-related carbohydrate-binding protein n=1 Tax=Actinoplanes sp. NPDC051861 TaxID=3155170 RepID=UPI00341AB9D9
MSPALVTRTLIAAFCSGLLVMASPAPAGAQPSRPERPGVTAPQVPGYGEVARPRAERPGALPRRTGRVPVKVASTSRSAPSVAAAANDRVALRALVVATDAEDFGVPTWKATLDRVGAAYDVLYTADTPVTVDTLVRADGTGRYNAVLLTNSMLVYASGGAWLSGLDSAEWNILWAYERNFGVRQAALYTSYGTWPEDHCLRSVGETPVGDTPLNIGLAPAGAGVFDYLRADVTVPVIQSYVYRTTIAPGCAAAPIVTSGSDVLGVLTTSVDGRERIALTFTLNQYLLQSDLLVYGLFRWASRGLFLGEQRHHLNVDVDDWFNSADHYYPDGHIEYDPGYRVSAREMVNLDNQQAALRTAYPAAAGFTYNLAFNGADIDPFAGNQCSPNGGPNELTATSKCLAGNFRWVNHTLNHPELNHTDYATSHAEILQNRAAGNAIGLGAPDDVLKTPEYSGLGVYTVDPDDDTGVPVDHGLAGSNPALLQAAEDLGVRYLHGNMSFASHKPAHLNTGTVHPLEPSISVVPDWPTNIAYFVTTPEEETAFYNSFYGPNGKFPYWPSNRTYEQILDYEADIALQHVSAGAINSHTFHIANVHDYGGGRSLVHDWVERVTAKYTTYYSVPLLNSPWSEIGAYTAARTAHFAQLSAGADVVYDRSAGTVTVTSSLAGTVQVGGVQAAGATTYGTDVTAPVTLTANTPVTLTAAPRA